MKKEKVYQLAMEYFEEQLRGEGGEEARRFMEDSLGLPVDHIREIPIGYAPPQWTGLKEYLTSKGCPLEDGVAAGMLVQRGFGKVYDRFRNRIVICSSRNGAIVGFRGRLIGKGEPVFVDCGEPDFNTMPANFRVRPREVDPGSSPDRNEGHP